MWAQMRFKYVSNGLGDSKNAENSSFRNFFPRVASTTRWHYVEDSENEISLTYNNKTILSSNKSKGHDTMIINNIKEPVTSS